jgi:hypothetical protein
MKKFKSRQFEQGQAIVEMVISIIAIMGILAGVIIVGQLGHGSLRNLLLARKDTDTKVAARTYSAPAGDPIADVNSGQDDLFFTLDDEPTVGSAHYSLSVDSDGNIYGFKEEVAINEPGKAGELDLSDMAGDLEYNFSLDFFTSSQLFLDAANLSEGSYTLTLPDDDEEIISSQLLNFFIGTDSISVQDKVYMPMLY